MSAEAYKFEPHSFAYRLCSWMYCSGCGLLRLHNPLTDWCASKGCNYADHPSYRNKVHSLTSPHR